MPIALGDMAAEIVERRLAAGKTVSGRLGNGQRNPYSKRVMRPERKTGPFRLKKSDATAKRGLVQETAKRWRNERYALKTWLQWKLRSEKKIFKEFPYGISTARAFIQLFVQISERLHPTPELFNRARDGALFRRKIQ